LEKIVICFSSDSLALSESNASILEDFGARIVEQHCFGAGEIII
jgi:hypothetical protein